MQNPLKPLLDLEEAATILGVSKKTLRAHISAGELPCINVGRGEKRLNIRIDPADLQDFIEKRKQCQNVAALPPHPQKFRGKQHFSLQDYSFTRKMRKP